MQLDGDRGQSANEQEGEEQPISGRLDRLIQAAGLAMSELPARAVKRESSYFPLSITRTCTKFNSLVLYRTVP